MIWPKIIALLDNRKIQAQSDQERQRQKLEQLMQDYKNKTAAIDAKVQAIIDLENELFIGQTNPMRSIDLKVLKSKIQHLGFQKEDLERQRESIVAETVTVEKEIARIQDVIKALCQKQEKFKTLEHEQKRKDIDFMNRSEEMAMEELYSRPRGAAQ